MAGQAAHIAFRRDEGAQIADFRRTDGQACKAGPPGQKRVDLARAFFGFQRAGAIDEDAARREKAGGMGQNAGLQGGELVAVARCFEAQHIGMAARGAGCRTRGIEEDAGPLPFGLPERGVGGDQFGCKIDAGKVLAHAFQTGPGAVERGDPRAHGGKFHRLAAGRGTEVEHFGACDLAEQARGDGRRGVLHPPGALIEARQRIYPCRLSQTQAACRQDLRTEFVRPVLAFVIVLYREVERRVGIMRFGDGAGGNLAIGTRPALEEPVRRVEMRHVEAGEQRVAFAVRAPENGVHQRLEMLGNAAGACAFHGHTDGGMGCDAHEEKFGKSDAQNVAYVAGARGQGLFKETVQHVVDAAEAAQRGRGDGAGKGTVARFASSQPAARRFFGESFVERAALLQNGAQQGGGSGAGCEALRRFLSGRCGHGRVRS